MYEDEPQDRVHDILAEAVFGDHPLGRRVLGEAEVISSIPVPDDRGLPRRPLHGRQRRRRRRRQRRPRPHRRARRAAGSQPPAGRTGAPEGRTPDGAARLRFYEKDTEQYHICFGAPGIARDDERRYALAVLDSIFGGSSSSRLFREVREKRGLAYSVGSYNEQYTDSGLVASYVGTREDNVEEACSIIGAELERLRAEPVSAEELSRAKENVKGRLVLSSESTAARMTPHLARHPLRSADRQPRRDAGQGRRGHRRGPDRAGGGAVRARAPLGRLRRRATRSSFREALAPGQRKPGRGVIRVAVSGAAGRMGEAVCEAVEGAEDTELVGRPILRSASSWPRSSATPTSSSTSPRRTPRSPTPTRLPGGGRPRRRRHHRLRPRGAAAAADGLRAPTASSLPTSRSARSC